MNHAATASTSHALATLIAPRQLAVMCAGLAGEENSFFRERIAELNSLVGTIPLTYQSDREGYEAAVWLHYFIGGCDWYITELDAAAIDGHHAQAFGIADIGHGPELGYISIPEILAAGAELDLHWTPTTVGTVMKRSNAFRGPIPSPKAATVCL